MQLLLKKYFVETTIFLSFALYLASWGVIKTGYFLFTYSRFAYFRSKSGVSPTHKKQLFVMF